MRGSGGMSHTAQAVFRTQGTCPKQWIAVVDGEPLRTAAGGVRRYSTAGAAERAAINVALALPPLSASLDQEKEDRS